VNTLLSETRLEKDGGDRRAGSLKPDEYAAVMAFLLSFDRVQPSSGGQEPFPTTDLAFLQQVELGCATCAPKN